MIADQAWAPVRGTSTRYIAVTFAHAHRLRPGQLLTIGDDTRGWCRKLWDALLRRPSPLGVYVVRDVLSEFSVGVEPYRAPLRTAPHDIQ